MKMTRSHWNGRDDLRKWVLKKNHFKETVYDRTGEQKIRLKKIVSVDKESIAIFTTVTICSSQLTEKEFELALATQKTVRSSAQLEHEKSPMERVDQAVYYGSKMVRLTRDVILEKRHLDKEWKTRDARSFVDGFVTQCSAENESSSSVRTTSESTSTKSAGYSCQTSLLFDFANNEQKNHLEDWKTVDLGREHWIHLEKRVKKDGFNLELLLYTHLLPKLYSLDSGWIEETCEYLLSKKEVVELSSDYKTSPGINYTPTVIFWGDSDPNSSVYCTPTKPDESQEFPRLNMTNSLNETGLADGKILAELVDLFSTPDVPVDRKIKVISSDQEKPSMTMEVCEPGRTGQKHNVTLTVEIGGKTYEFKGSFVYDGPKEFQPKRVLVDGNCVWQNNSDWKPSHPVKKAEIDMSLGNKK